MTNIIEELSDSSMPVVFPVHPPTKNPLHESRSPERMPGNVRLIKPLRYLDMLMADARKILTDSGCIQKKGYMLGLPCNRLRGIQCAKGRWKKISVRGAGIDARMGGVINMQHILTLFGAPTRKF